MSANERLDVVPWLPGHDRLDERGAASSAPLKVTSAMVQERVLEWDLKWHGQVDEVHKAHSKADTASFVVVAFSPLAMNAFATGLQFEFQICIINIDAFAFVQTELQHLDQRFVDAVRQARQSRAELQSVSADVQALASAMTGVFCPSAYKRG